MAQQYLETFFVDLNCMNPTISILTLQPKSIIYSGAFFLDGSISIQYPWSYPLWSLIFALLRISVALGASLKGFILYFDLEIKISFSKLISYGKFD